MKWKIRLGAYYAKGWIKPTKADKKLPSFFVSFLE
jgi:hypothetical protein